MPQICLYLQLHQPYRLGEFNVFDISHGRSYFEYSSKLNEEVFQKVSQKSYLPMLRLLYQLTQWHPGFHVALSASGIFLEQAQLYQPEVIELLQKLAQTGQVEFLAETYYHSLAALYSPAEFKYQVQQHENLIQQLFDQTPSSFRNTELVYSNEVGALVAEMGYQIMLTEAVDRYLHGRDRTQLYVNTTQQLPLLLKHAQLSDDVAFRFSNKGWPEYPLTVDKYLYWTEMYPEDHLVNLFMDFETFGEHQWADTGIFEFFEHFVAEFLKREWNGFVTPGQIAGKLENGRTGELESGKRGERENGEKGKLENGTIGKHFRQLPVYDVPVPISWADIDRDLTAWIDNEFQKDTLGKLYHLEEQITKAGDEALLTDWRRLQTSDHFYYMCTKWSADGDVHAYFSPYDSPYEAYRKYSIVLADLRERVTLYFGSDIE